MCISIPKGLEGLFLKFSKFFYFFNHLNISTVCTELFRSKPEFLCSVNIFFIQDLSSNSFSLLQFIITIEIITARHFHVIEMNLMDLKQLAMAAEMNLRLTIKKAIKMKTKSVLMPKS